MPQEQKGQQGQACRSIVQESIRRIQAYYYLGCQGDGLTESQAKRVGACLMRAQKIFTYYDKRGTGKGACDPVAADNGARLIGELEQVGRDVDWRADHGAENPVMGFHPVDGFNMLRGLCINVLTTTGLAEAKDPKGFDLMTLAKSVTVTAKKEQGAGPRIAPHLAAAALRDHVWRAPARN